MITRREFTCGAAALAVASSAKSYSQIMGANDKLSFAVIGLNSRAYAHLSSLKANQAKARISHVCDVDTVILQKFAAATHKSMGTAPATDKDFRKILALKDVDAITIATPDHWHAPMAIAGLQAGKHVYVEKPCSHNPAEGVLLVQAQQKYGKLVQMGTQRRSSPLYIDVIDQIHNGLVGQAYYAKAWYSNTRKSIGVGKVAPVPYQGWTGIYGKARRLVRSIRTMFSLITGTGSKHGELARPSIMARTRSMFAVGPSALVCQNASRRRADDTTSRTTGNSTTHSTPALDTMTS